MSSSSERVSGQSHSAQLLAPSWHCYLLALAFFVAVFAIVPFTIFADASDDWGFPYYQMLYIPAFGIVLYIASAVIIRLIALAHAGAAAGIAYGLFCLGVLILLGHVYAPVKLGPLDGSAMTSDEPLFDTLIEVAAAALLLVLLAALVRGRAIKPTVVFSLALIGIAIGYVGVFAYSYHAGQEQLKTSIPIPPRPLSGNVYHIVLDTLQTDAFLAALEKTGLKENFAGFNLFENNISNYTTTVASSASYFTGQYYQSGDYKEWTRSWRDSGRGILATLSETGYQVWMYSPFPTWNNQYTDHFRYNVDIYEEEGGFADVGLYDLIHIWIASLAPNFLTNEALPVAATLRDWLFVTLTGKARPLSIDKGLHPFAGMSMLRRLARDEHLRPGDGQYVYAHAALPHAPFVLDEDCRYIGKRAHGDRAKQHAAYLQQTRCALRLVDAFFDELRRLGRFHSATVVLHADTGHGLFLETNGERGGAKTLGIRNERLLSSINALLMIKRPQASGPLTIRAAPTQLIDLYPTMLEILQLKSSYAPHGRSVYRVQPQEPRMARFGFDPNDKHGAGIIEVQVEQPTDLKGSGLTVLGPATGPATWTHN